MTTFNQVTLAGNLTRDPELRHLPTGAAVCEASLAINDKYKTKSGEKVEKTHFVDLVIWAASGERFAEWFRKGENLLVTGKLEQDRWENDTGEKRSKIRVNVRSFERCGSRNTATEPAQQGDGHPEFRAEDAIPF